MITDPGTYRARALSAVLGEPSGKEGGSTNVPLVINFELTDEHVKGQRMDAYLYFTEKTAKRSIESLRILGYEGDDLSAVEFPADNECDLVCAIDTYKGESKMKVQWINAVGQAAVKRLAPADAKAFAAKMRGQFLAVDAAGGPKTEKAPY